MKLPITLSLIIGMMITINAQTVAHFENLEVQTNEFINGSDLSGGFESGNVFLPNNFNESYQSWLGWAISGTTDTTTPGFNNQYSAITGSGAEGSTAYAVNFSSGPNIIRLTEVARDGVVNGMYITNSTYAYLSMQNGDAFSKRFGGETGDDPDFFLLTIKTYSEGQLSSDSVDFYLADYRFEDNNNDYLIDQWTWLDLISLGNCDSLSLSLSSSDNGQWGMNTPAFFCVDNVTTKDVSTNVTKVTQENGFDVFPNPVQDVLNVKLNHRDGVVRLVDSKGVLRENQVITDRQVKLQMQNLLPGLYYVQVASTTGTSTRAVVKR